MAAINEKLSYIFNCSGKFDLMLGLQLYTVVQAIIPEVRFNKYCCIFKCADGKLRSRSGSVKNSTTNFSKYLLELGQIASMSCLEFYTKTKIEDTRNSCWFDISAGKTTFNISIAGINLLPEYQIIDIWTKLQRVININYMVAFPLGASKINRFTVHGYECYSVLMTMKEQEQYYSKSEKEMIALLNDLQLYENGNLKCAFPLCIATEKAIVDEQGYVSKKKIDNKAYLYKKD